MSDASAIYSDTMLSNLQRDIRVILLGRSGEGKSALGNLILRDRIFKTGAGAGSVTRECQSSSTVFNNRKLTVIDTPGVFDTKLSSGDIARELTHCYYETAPGPHAFLIVTAGRHTAEAEKTLVLLTQLFGESVVDYCIVVITHEDDLIFNNTTKEEFLGDQTSKLRCFVNKCGGRCIAVNSKTKDSDEREAKIMELLQCIDNISGLKQSSYYTHELFQKAAQDEVERQHDEEQKERDQLGEEEIRIQEDHNLLEREEDVKKKQDEQRNRLEKRRGSRSAERNSRTSGNAMKTSSDTHHGMGYRRFPDPYN